MIDEYNDDYKRMIKEIIEQSIKIAESEDKQKKRIQKYVDFYNKF